ncbi:solute carrier family 25 (mitochondrial folate transporter), member 32 [Fistulifera solaris]|uniref:Solute carrier family 25 (Mitochondrial folate transporter), member 32 n=1 Tax=Fistulifera solaris TaxID=1519565 RepID=A0A1Z5KMI1_FISSO|nr:solute carrier family 25 (mitochondrial folate transporter), member 32 [Fistulifera solaris]|eukprot:GAX27148.1 solute carrier family 25 (mitochondrial folate transporter), member 32 [Fistulifera solaris]
MTTPSTSSDVTTSNHHFLKQNRKHSLPVAPRDYVHLYSSLLAGAGSGALASITCAPLDLVRTRLQVWGERRGQMGAVQIIPQMIREIVAKEGWRGCFRGLGATLITVPAFWGVYFPVYNDLKRHGASAYPQYSTAIIHMGAAVSAGAVSDVLCNPLFVIRTRIQTDFLHGGGVPKSIVATARSLLRESGGNYLIFWRGMTANMLGLSHVGVQFPVYERLKRMLRQNQSRNTAFHVMIASALSKMTACVLTYPHEVIRSRMMDARSQNGFVPTCRQIYAKEGWAGFYAGLPVSLVRVIPNTCITFVTYELFCQWSREMIDEYRSK